MVNDKPVPWPSARIVVRYTAGYVLPGETDNLIPAGYFHLPADVEAGCLALVRRLYFGRDRDPGVRSVGSGGDSVTYGTFGRLDGEGMPGEVVSLLSPYWLPRMRQPDERLLKGRDLGMRFRPSAIFRALPTSASFH